MTSVTFDLHRQQVQLFPACKSLKTAMHLNYRECVASSGTDSQILQTPSPNLFKLSTLYTVKIQLILLYSKSDALVAYNYPACLARGEHFIENCLELL